MGTFFYFKGMKRIFIILVLGICMPACAQIDRIEASRVLIRELMQRDKIPGLSVSVSVRQQLVWSEGFGFADLEQNVRVDPAFTKFRIGSVSKPLTAMAMGLLIQQGKLDADEPIQAYVPSFPEKTYPITLRLLAGHLAGIRHYRGNEFLSAKHYPTAMEGLDIFKDDPLINVPGTTYSYSSYGWNLISVAIEQAANTPFLEFMKTRVFLPMGMNNTEADQVYDIIPGRTRFYAPGPDGQIANAPFVDNSYKWAGGGFISTSEDLVRFGNALLSNTLLQKETQDALIHSQQTTGGEMTNYGMGFRTSAHDGKPWYGHSGGSVGGITMFIVYPEQELVIALVTNSSNVNYGPIPHEIAALFME